MRGNLYLLPLCLFCLSCFARAVPVFPLFTSTASARSVPPLAGSVGPGIVRNSDPTPAPTPAPDDSSVADPPIAVHSRTDNVSPDWQTFDSAAHGLTLSYPPGWLFFDWTQADALHQEMAEQGRADIVHLLMKLQSTVQPSSLLGFSFSFPQTPPVSLHANNVVVEIFPTSGLTMYEFGQGAAAALDRQLGTDVDDFNLVTRLRPHREETISIRFRGDLPPPATSQSVLTGARIAGWQVILLSPDANHLLVLTFTVLGEQFAGLEPLLTEMVQRIRWKDEPRDQELDVSPVTTTNRAMIVYNEPALFSPVVGKIDSGETFSILERDITGNWWRVSYGGQPGWVSDPFAAAHIPDAPVAVPLAMIDRRVNVRSGPGANNPVISLAAAGQQYLITGRNEAGDWWQIDKNGQIGWVLGDLVNAVDVRGVQVAVIKFPAPPMLPVTEALMTVNRTLNVRAGPDNSYPIVGETVPGHSYLITGKSATGDWWRIDEDGQIGWIHSELVELVNVGSVRVVVRYPLPPLLPANEAVLTFNRSMNVYSGPGSRFPVIDTTIPGYQYAITGRNVVGNWWQIDNHGQSGWVFGQFVNTVAETDDTQ